MLKKTGQNNFSIKSCYVIIVLLLACCLFSNCSARTEKASNKQTRTADHNTHVITDMAGRRAEIPADIEKVYSTG